ncbi:DUF3891 family protein [Pedobacter aquatilis]|uniref:DUF3891 family protein n=1 Tax=Pedobacter aquatilis TaxID=351343 RepID=UPI0029303389|nr:DUF3891 family protein [Pedobacter aquatilis]
MIVNYTKEGWEIITQRCHGLLAGQICAEWKISERPERWIETLISTTEHDDVFNEFNISPLLTSTGGPIDFAMTKFDQNACSRMIDMALTKSRFIALLFARHIAFTHGEEPMAKKYLARLKKLEKQWLKDAQISVGDVDYAYSLLEFCDAFSLLICQHLIPPEKRNLEIGQGPHGRSYEFFQHQDGRLIVSPWPFEVSRFEIAYERITLASLTYKSEDDFRKAIRAAKIIRQNIIISKN